MSIWRPGTWELPTSLVTPWLRPTSEIFPDRFISQDAPITRVKFRQCLLKHITNSETVAVICRNSRYFFKFTHQKHLCSGDILQTERCCLWCTLTLARGMNTQCQRHRTLYHIREVRGAAKPQQERQAAPHSAPAFLLPVSYLTQLRTLVSSETSQKSSTSQNIQCQTRE